MSRTESENSEKKDRLKGKISMAMIAEEKWYF